MKSRDCLILLPVLMGSVLAAQPRVDNVLVKMVPPGSTSLVGTHMDLIKQTEMYRKLLASQNLSQVDQFARETGFDPRRDVRELLLFTGAKGMAMLARGTFNVNTAKLNSAKILRHGEYEIRGQGNSGFCILDSSLAAAGDIPAIEAALDEWKSGAHTGAQPLLARAAAVSPQAQFWGVSTGTGNFLADHPPALNSGLDFSRIFRGLEETWFQADLSAGLRAELHGTAAAEKDAVNLRDTVRGVVGLGRLSVPESEPDLLRVWDGIAVDQQGRAVSVRMDIGQDLVDRLTRMLKGGAAMPRRIL